MILTLTQLICAFLIAETFSISMVAQTAARVSRGICCPVLESFDEPPSLYSECSSSWNAFEYRSTASLRIKYKEQDILRYGRRVYAAPAQLNVS